MSEEKFDAWAIVELFGHQRMAGRITEASVGGCQFIRVDVPPVGENAGYTRLLGQGAIYAINLVDEPVARAAAESYRTVPVSSYEIPALRQAQLAFDRDRENDYHEPVDDEVRF